MFEQIIEKYGEAILPLYKSMPPFVENDNGIGFKGVLLWDSERDLIQCSECGEWHESISVGRHLSKHGLNAKKYKDKYGLFNKTPLMNQAMLRQRSENGKKRAVENREKMIASLRSANRPGYKLAEQNKNRYGTCDAQLKARFEQRMAELGRLPHLDELDIRGTINRRFGSYEKALATWGYLEGYSKYQRERYTPENLLKILRNFKKQTGRDMVYSDFKTAAVNFPQFKRAFGSFAEAKKISNSQL